MNDVPSTLDDPSISDAEVAYRQVLNSSNQLVWDDNAGDWRLTSAAFRDPHGNGEISIYLKGRLRQGETAADVAALRPGSVAFGFAVGDARRVDFGVTYRPDQDDGPLRHAHGSVNEHPTWVGADFRTARNALLRTMVLAAGEVTVPRRP